MSKDKGKDSEIIHLKSVPKPDEDEPGLRLTIEFKNGNEYGGVVYYCGASEDFEGFLVVGESETSTRIFALSDITEMLLEDA